MDVVYEPSDDTFLLADVVKGEMKESLKVLDMGTGSGYLGFLAKDAGCAVTFVDINPEAIKLVREKSPRVQAIVSDLFKSVRRQKFDLVMFNTPYLPDEEDAQVKDVALHGGKKGNEIALRFLQSVRGYIDPDSTIYMLVSTLGNPKDIDKFLDSHSFAYEIVARKKLFFEELLVYKIQRLSELQLSKAEIQELLGFIPDKYEDVKVHAKGKRGVVFCANHEGKKVAIKVALPSSTAHNAMFLEGKNLRTVNKLHIGPKLIEATHSYVAMEFVEGELIGDYLKKADEQDKLDLFAKIDQQLFMMDRLRFNKFELTNPYKHIIITDDGTPVLIDFERAKYTSRPKNLAQFEEYKKKFME